MLHKSLTPLEDIRDAAEFLMKTLRQRHSIPTSRIADFVNQSNGAS
jgi:hypothetical protein